MPRTCPPALTYAAKSISQPCSLKNFKSPIVDFVPGNKTKSESSGKGCPGDIISTEIFGSAERGSKSSKFAIRESFRHYNFKSFARRFWLYI